MSDVEMAANPAETYNRTRFLDKVVRRFPRTVGTYFSLDPRSLGVARIYLGALLLYDLLRRVPGLSTWYSNDGLLPNHAMLWRPSANWVFSLFFAASTPQEAAVMFALCGAVFFGLLIGWHTRLCHALSLVCLVSLHSRAIFLENGGDVVLNLLCLWTLFLPMGARFSVDALQKRLSERREHSVAELNDQAAFAATITPVLSLVALAILLQLAVVYHFNAVHKHGRTWRTGTAVHYVLYQERMVTWLGWKVRPFITLNMSRAMTYATLAVEAAAAFLLLNPIHRLRTRRLALIVLPGLHLSFALLLNVGMFSFNMIGFIPLLISPADWTLLARWMAPDVSRARTVYLVEECAWCFWTARILRRLDAFERLQFVALPEASAAGPRFLVEDRVSGQRASGVPAIAAFCAALPCGLPLSVVLRLPVVSWLARSIFERLAAHEKTLARWLCIDGPSSTSNLVGVPSPARLWLVARRGEMREIAVAFTMVIIASQVLTENKAVPKILKVTQPPWVQQMVVYPRAFQGWSMFTPDVPTGERMIYVDAMTASGRHVDPFNEGGSRIAGLPVTRIPPFMDQNEFWCDYTNRIPDNRAYWEALKAWVFSYHHRTGHDEDRVLSFELRSFEVESPAPGEQSSKNPRSKLMLTETATTSN